MVSDDRIAFGIFKRLAVGILFAPDHVEIQAGNSIGQNKFALYDFH